MSEQTAACKVAVSPVEVAVTVVTPLDVADVHAVVVEPPEPVAAMIPVPVGHPQVPQAGVVESPSVEAVPQSAAHAPRALEIITTTISRCFAMFLDGAICEKADDSVSGKSGLL
jgi:hypothetical protein